MKDYNNNKKSLTFGGIGISTEMYINYIVTDSFENN